jgi:Xaa-Pro dipeptidase
MSQKQYPSRVQAILDLAQAEGLDALALVPGPNLTYMSGLGFHLSERPIIAFFTTDGRVALVLPDLEAGKAETAGIRTFSYTDDEGYALTFHEACAQLELVELRVGVEALRMRVLESRILHRYIPSVVLVPADELFSALRMVKAADELAAMRRAVKVAEDAFRGWLTQLHIGMTEREAAARLVAALLTGGADALAFAPIVAGGPNGGLPHAVPGDRTFKPGDWVVVDWGAKVDGYISDITRMLVFGEPGGRLAEVHSIVAEANAAGRAAVCPSVAAQVVDAAARSVIEAGGYGQAFIHRTGHGIGRETHEPPYIVEGNALSLKPGMTFTIEPGVYLEGLGGIRIEDNVVVTEAGAETLTTLPRSPFVI